jgi:capsular exopolysaccharide synthesis family protein
MNPTPETRGLGGGFAAMRRRWKIVVGVVVIIVAVAVYHQATKPKSYKATSDVTFDASSLSQTALAATAEPPDPTRDGPTDVLIATSLSVARAVRSQLNLAVPAIDLQDDISAQVAPNANVLQITASASTPAMAAQLADAFATQYVNFETGAQLAAIDKAQTSLQTQLDALPAGSSQRSTIEASIQRLAPLRAVADGGSQIISSATAPDKPSGASVPVVAVVSVLIGFALAFLIVFLVESLDRRIESADQIEAEYGLPLLCTIPAGKSGTDAVSRGGLLEPFRILRTTIELASERPIKTLLVTSAVSGEGKTTVAVDLAHAAALTGRQVTLIELDLRRPTFGRQFSIDPRRGFTTVVVGGEPLADMLVEPIKGLPNLRVLPSGPLPPNPADLIESRLTSQLIRDLAGSDGLVIIDAPPLNPVADAQVLLSSPVLDAAIVVARRGVSTRDGIRRARRILDRHLLQPLGVVVNGTADVGQYDYGYAEEAVDRGRTVKMRGRHDVRTDQQRSVSLRVSATMAGNGTDDSPDDSRLTPQRRIDQLTRAERSQAETRQSGS